ncbi:MAG: class I SAM-dependent RNA methyltransferase [Notoacmeibacter sp.]|nr:class I SAM-dependent RNA methyltransferase [Notoacmeibacter sp.]MCC0033016.1 class I SAM-dependent RNA methyltransferase [Brucellaceae bacterium]
MSLRVTIDHLGAQGDGVAKTPGGPVYVPFTLPGEVVNVAVAGKRAEPVAILEASQERVEPACRHFTTCGGCALQHWQGDAYRAWKRGLVTHALEGRGIKAEVAPLAACAPGTRRRAVFTARHGEAGIELGFNRAFSNQLVDIAECPVTDARIIAALDRLRQLAAIIAGTSKPFHLTVTATASGLDIAAEGSGKLPEAERQRASRFTIENRFARLSVDGEIIIEPVKPQVMFGDVAAVPPPGGFLQAVPEAEETMAGLVLAHVGKSKKVADLFAGSGTFTLRLAKRAEVWAVESDAPALAALEKGFRGGAGLKKVTAERRDLFQRPLLPRELIGVDAVVFDPPRAGAEAQAKHLAKSGVTKIAAVSCNPVTLARDLEILIAGGYTLKSVTPVDQFLWSPHVEAIALLEKPKKRR